MHFLQRLSESINYLTFENSEVEEIHPKQVALVDLISLCISAVEVTLSLWVFLQSL